MKSPTTTLLVIWIPVLAFALPLTVDENWSSRTVDCDGGQLVLQGNNNYLKANKICSELMIRGTGNTVEIESVGTISITGNMNKVRWESGIQGKDPRVTTEGFGNMVSKTKTSPAKDQAGGDDTTVSGESGSKVLSEREILIDKDKERRTIDCENGARVTVRSNENKLELRGTCTRLSVTGHRNEIDAEILGIVNTTGNGNMIRWKKGVDGKEPRINNSGKNNKIAAS